MMAGGASGATRGLTYCDRMRGGEWEQGCATCATCGAELPSPENMGAAAFAARYQWPARPPTIFCPRPARCRKEWQRNHVWNVARGAAIRRDRRCVRAAAPDGCTNPYKRLEVNHKRPLVDLRGEYSGDGPGGTGRYETGCQHHLDGLETLCHDHHVEATRRQAAERRERERGERERAEVAG